MIGSFHFLRPDALWLWLPVMGLLWLLHRNVRGDRTWKRIMDPHLLDALAVVPEGSRSKVPLRLYAAFLCVGIVALAGPAWKKIPSPFAEDQAPLAIAIEVTPSMAQTDVTPSRLERAVLKLHDILARRSGARTALLAYAGSAHVVMPLTRDAAIIESFAGALHPDIMPREGDQPALALELAMQTLGERQAGGSVLFMTDGITVDEAKQMAEQKGSVHVILFGACPFDDQAPERQELKRAAGILDAPLVFLRPDDKDVEDVVSSMQRHMASSDRGEEGQRWRDDGYWLLPVLALLALPWFRRGWLMAEVHE